MAQIPSNTAHFFFDLPEAGLEGFQVFRFAGVEAVSDLFRFEVHLLHTDPDIDFEQVVYQAGHLEIACGDGTDRSANRHFYGIISDFRLVGAHTDQFEYTAILVPRAFLLTLRSGSRIFQDKSTQQILEQVMGDAGLTNDDFSIKLTDRGQETRSYCTQYQETDYHFLSRLMEEEGIFFFFDHDPDAGRSVWVATDNNDGLSQIKSPAKVRYYETNLVTGDEEIISQCRYQRSVHFGKVAFGDYNYESPDSSLSVAREGARFRELEQYRYPGHYQEIGVGEKQVKVRSEQHFSKEAVLWGQSDRRGFESGRRFELTEHYRSALNSEYLLIRIEHEGVQGGALIRGDREQGTTYVNRFEAIPYETAYRPDLKSAWPVVRGVQTATVVGPRSEDIYIDDLGRIKVLFHWDRDGRGDETSSCWVRVCQDYAGPDYGIQFIPRVGHEVIVDFIEGDPDRPLVIGSVYNGANTPPLDPANKTQNIIKTPTNNKIQFEDREGEEKLIIRAQKDHLIEVVNDETVSIGNDRSQEIKHDVTVEIGNNETRKVGKDVSITIEGNMTSKTTGTETLKVDGLVKNTYGNAVKTKIASNLTLQADGQGKLKIGGKQEAKIGADLQLSVGGKMTQKVTGGLKVEAMSITLKAMQGITLQCGSGTIKIDAAGNVTVQGLMVKSAASVMNEIVGAIVKIN